MLTFWAILKTSIFMYKLRQLLFGQLMEILGYFIFQRLVTLHW